MRTLFLLGILIVLTTIAFKKPDQTATEAVRSMGTSMRHVVSKATDKISLPPVAPRVEAPPVQKKKFAFSLPKPVAPASSSAEAEPEPRTTVAAEPKPSTVVVEEPVSPTAMAAIEPPKVSPVSPTEKPKQAARKIAKPQAGLPNLQWLKSLPVLKKSGPAPVASPITTSEPTPAPQSGYADVKVYYENASRLLEQIK